MYIHTDGNSNAELIQRHTLLFKMKDSTTISFSFATKDPDVLLSFVLRT